MIDTTGNSRNRVRVAPVDPDLPLGLCPPQLHNDTGFDLMAAQDVAIAPMMVALVPVNARLELPTGFYADLRNRSSMARRNLYVDHALIDNGYRGPLFVILRNMNMPALRALTQDEVNRALAMAGHPTPSGLVIPGQEGISYHGPNVAALDGRADPGTVMVSAGERIAQLVFHRGTPVWIEPVAEVSLDTERGENGFGSTGQ